MIFDIISKERLQKYLIATGYNKERALALYGWNIQLSEAFFPVLSGVEVSLRNIIATRLIEQYGDNWWKNDAFLLQIADGKGVVKRAGAKLGKVAAVTSGRMTAELTFGFWVKMLLPRHEDALWQNLHADFYDLPASISYIQLHARCDAVRQFRNRVFHHEPIFNSNITQEYSNITQLLDWLSHDKAVWIKKYSRAMTVLRQKP